jgi:hypothetical protein
VIVLVVAPLGAFAAAQRDLSTAMRAWRRFGWLLFTISWLRKAFVNESNHQGRKMASNFVVFDQLEFGRQLGLMAPDGSLPDRALKAVFNGVTRLRSRPSRERGPQRRR